MVFRKMGNVPLWRRPISSLELGLDPHEILPPLKKER